MGASAGGHGTPRHRPSASISWSEPIEVSVTTPTLSTVQAKIAAELKRMDDERRYADQLARVTSIPLTPDPDGHRMSEVKNEECTIA